MDSPFDAWSRVKSGTTHAKTSTRGDIKHSLTSPLRRPVSAPLPRHHGSETKCRSSTPITTSAQPLVSSAGRITRRPFDALNITKPKPQTPKSPQLARQSEPCLDLDDEVIVWTNPITKVRSNVNERTGLTLPSISSTLTRTSTAAGNRNLTLRKKIKPTINTLDQEPTPWLGSILGTWENPTFKTTEISIPQVSIDGPEAESQKLLHGRSHNCSQVDIDKAFKDTSAGIDGRISKEAIRNAEVISQVDKKFILVKLCCSKSLQLHNDSTQDMLVIIDQHAADERIRIEALMTELCTAPTTLGESSIITTYLEKPLSYDISSQEIVLLKTHKQHFSNWGILYKLAPEPPSGSDSDTHRLIIHSLPPGIAERCKSNPRLLIDLIRTEVWRIHSLPSSHTIHQISTSAEPTTMSQTTAAQPPPPHHWLTKLHTCPPVLLDMLNSRACRSAIMFNDELTKTQCEVLVRRLAECAFPFQCAHGRPSLVPLVDLGRVGCDEEVDIGGFGEAMNRWKDAKGQRT